MGMNQRLLPEKLWNALVPTLLSSMFSVNSKAVLDLGLALRAIEKFPKHARTHSSVISSEQLGPRGEYWQFDIRVGPDSMEINANKMEAYFDGDRSAIDGFSLEIRTVDAIASPQLHPLLSDSLMPELIEALTSKRHWRTHVLRKKIQRISD